MYVVCVTSWVKPEFVVPYMAACEANAAGSRREPGCLRFDFLRCIEAPNQFFFYEVYRTEADFKSHQQTRHYFTWRDTVTEWMEKPRIGVKHTSVSPMAEADW